ncbi:hypothetical protein [Lysinibacillus fusiformis]|uniref:hypothetical protein n=1 Tax=Lysinibacillus fusiformis TaxID=28031 RepID=UPI003017A00F
MTILQSVSAIGGLASLQAKEVKVFKRAALEVITTSTFSVVPSTHWAIVGIEKAATERMVKNERSNTICEK